MATPKCANCNGLMTPDEDEMLKCANCGRRVLAKNGHDDITINIELKPKDFKELIAGLARAHGHRSATGYLASLGLRYGRANKMARGDIFYAEALVALIDHNRLDDRAVMALIRATVNGRALPDTALTGRRNGARAKNGSPL